jgi:hypothetical protein
MSAVRAIFEPNLVGLGAFTQQESTMTSTSITPLRQRMIEGMTIRG